MKQGLEKRMASFSRNYVLALAIVLACVTATPGWGQGAQKQAGVETASGTAQKVQNKKKSPSDRAVRVIVGFAWTLVPEEYPGKDGKKVKVDKSDPAKFMIPMEDARRVIRVAHRSANAQICDLPEHQTANYVKLMKREQDSDKWSKEQLLFINRLHLFTVQWLTGNVEFAEAKEKKEKKDPETIKKRLKEVAKKKSKRTCTADQREKVKQQIEQYVREAKKS